MSRGPLASAEIRNRADTGVLRGPASSNPVNVAPVFRRIDFGIWEIGRYLVPAYRYGHGNASQIRFHETLRRLNGRINRR